MQAAADQQEEQSHPLAASHRRAAAAHAQRLCGGDFLGSVELTASIGPCKRCFGRLECRALLPTAIEQEESEALPYRRNSSHAVGRSVLIFCSCGAKELHLTVLKYELVYEAILELVG